MSGRSLLLTVTLLWLGGVALRLPVLAVPPVLTMVQADLAMSGTEVGILSGLPITLFAIAALPGSLLIAHIGAVPALVAGLLIAALGSALRGAAADVAVLFAATVVMGSGIAVMQPALPAVVRHWLPNRIGFATAVYANGLIVGEILPVAVMVPLILPLMGGDWRWALAFWAVPLVGIAILTVAGRPRAAITQVPDIAPVRWWPDWKDGLVWRFALILGSVNTAYFSANAFLPGYLEDAGRPDLIGIALTALNLGQLPASVVLLAAAGGLAGRGWPLVGAGLACMACIVGIVTTASWWTVGYAAGLGFFAAAVLALSLALPPLLKAPSEIAPVSAAMFAIGYTEAVAGSVLGGFMWDATGRPAAAFLPLFIVLLPLVVLPLTMRFERAAVQPG